MNTLDAQGHALLRWHLEHNHVPPVPLNLHPFALRAIELQGSDEVVKIDGSKFLLDNRQQTVTARQVCDGWHLWDFVHQLQRANDLDLTPEDAQELRQVEKDITGE